MSYWDEILDGIDKTKGKLRVVVTPRNQVVVLVLDENERLIFIAPFFGREKIDPGVYVGPTEVSRVLLTVFSKTENINYIDVSDILESILRNPRIPVKEKREKLRIIREISKRIRSKRPT